MPVGVARETDLTGGLILGLCDDPAVAVHDGFLIAFWTRGGICPREGADVSSCYRRQHHNSEQTQLTAFFNYAESAELVIPRWLFVKFDPWAGHKDDDGHAAVRVLFRCCREIIFGR